jgi:hypothetical protein
MNEGKERRRHPRRQVEGVAGILRARTEVELLNLSLTGAAVATPARLPMNETYRVRIGRGPLRLDHAATVVRSTLRPPRRQPATETPPVYEIGLEFQDVLGERGWEMAHFLGEHVERELGGRICDRFLPPPGTRVELEREQEFALHSISSTGMEIETEAELAPGQDVALEIRLGAGFATAGKVVYSQPVAPGRFRFGIESVGGAD